MVSVQEWQPKADDRSLTDDVLKVEPNYLRDFQSCLTQAGILVSAERGFRWKSWVFRAFQEGAITMQRFTKASRLLGPSQFSPVFSQARYRVSSSNLLVLVRPSQQSARLGLVVAKKNVRLAVKRNQIKRLIREAFRVRQAEFGTIDMVVLARSGLGSLNKQEISQQIHQLFDELLEKLNYENNR
jgi:ribonuclease P protein component